MIRRLVLLVALVAACGDDPGPPVTIEAHGLRVTVTPSPARIEIVRLADDAVIFDGTDLAFRAAIAEYETQTGAFKIEDDTEVPWREVGGFGDVAADGDAITFTLGGLGEGRVAIDFHDELEKSPVATITLDADDAHGFTRATIRTPSPADEHLLGLGGQAFDVDHRGQTVPLWVEEDGITKRDDDRYEGVWFLSGRRHSTHTPMPIVASSRGYVAALETDARAIFALASEGEDTIRFEAWEDRLALHLFAGTPDDFEHPLPSALSALTAWTGRPDAPPESVFAPWLDALYGSAEVRRVAQKLRDEDVPISAIWTEDWRGGNDEGTGYVLEEDWRVDRDLYPDFEAVADDLHAAGFLWLTYANTFIDESADVFDEAIAEGYTTHDASGDPYLFTGVKFRDAALLDLTNPDAVAWAKDIYGEALALGADGWMADFGEWLQHDAVLASGEDPLRAHNRYPVEWARLNHDLAPAIYFMRAAWLGSQPLVQVMWAGDQQTDWTVGDGMPSVIPIGLGLGLTGFPYYGHDIGGYMSQLTVPTTKELWFRWCTLGALTPVMRTHHGRSARMNWNWESDAETTAHLARWARVHMRLVPYLVQMSDEFQRRGVPIMRPVALGYPDADGAWTSTDQYLLGDRILVAPVIEEGATSREVSLPTGTWYPMLGGAPIAGGETITVDAPVTEIPAFVAEGAVLTMFPDAVDTVVGGTTSDRVLVVFPGFADEERLAHGVGGSGAIQATWTGCADAPAMPTTATVDGAEVPVTIVDGDAAVTVVTSPDGNTIAFDTCGQVSLTGGDGVTTYEVRLRVPG